MESNEKNKILVIDDEEEILEVLSLILSKEGYKVFTSTEGETAVDIIRNENIGLVLCDLNLGEESGLSILKSIKIIQPDMNFIMITGYGSIDVAVEAMREGAFDFIEKPVRRHNIIKVVEKAFENLNLILENRILKQQLKEKNDQNDKDFVKLKIGSTFKQIEEAVINKTLEYAKGNKEIAAQILGVDIAFIHQRIDNLN